MTIGASTGSFTVTVPVHSDGDRHPEQPAHRLTLVLVDVDNLFAESDEVNNHCQIDSVTVWGRSPAGTYASA